MARTESLSVLLVVLLAFTPPLSALSLDGVTAFGQVVTLNAATDGKIKDIPVQPGQRVAPGDLLVEIDSTQQQARLNRAEAITRGLQPDVTIAALELERAHELYALDSLSQVDLQNAENKLMRAEGQFKAAEAERDIAADDLARTRVTAPFEATVDRLHAAVAEYVNPAVETSPLVTLVATRSMKAVALIDADQWNPRLLGRSASVRVAGQQFKGKVEHLSRRAQRNSGANAKFELHVWFTADRPLAEGLTAKIDIKD